MKQDIFDGEPNLADPTEDIDDVLSKFDAINSGFSFGLDFDSEDDSADDKGADSSPEAYWHDSFASLGLRMCEGDATTGRHLTVAPAHNFEAGQEILREEPVISVWFSEPWTPLETRLLEHFKLSKIAPPYRLLCRCIEHDSACGHEMSSGTDSGGGSDSCRRRLLHADSVAMHMGANLEVASSKWPAAFCAFLAEASGAEAACVTRMLAIIKTNAFGIYSMAASDSTQAVSDPLHVAITDVGLSNMGLGLYLLVGRCNHECDPSAVWTFEDCAIDKTVSSARSPSALISHATSSGAGDLTSATSACMVLRALRPLRPGDPVTISYLLPREPVSTRQQKLRESYCFNCVCSRCAAEAPKAEALSAAASELRQMRAGLEGLAVRGELGKGHAHALDRCSALLDELAPPGSCIHPETATVLIRLAKWCVLASENVASEATSTDQGTKPSKRNGATAKKKKRDVGTRDVGAGAAPSPLLDKAIAHLQRAREMIRLSLGPSHSVHESLENALPR